VERIFSREFSWLGGKRNLHMVRSMLSGGKISSASICIHRPQDQLQVMPRSSEHRIIENRKNRIRPDPGLVCTSPRRQRLRLDLSLSLVSRTGVQSVRRLNSCPAARYATNL
jgi:hypothetical protein